MNYFTFLKLLSKKKIKPIKGTSIVTIQNKKITKKTIMKYEYNGKRVGNLYLDNSKHKIVLKKDVLILFDDKKKERKFKIVNKKGIKYNYVSKIYFKIIKVDGVFKFNIKVVKGKNINYHKVKKEKT